MLPKNTQIRNNFFNSTYLEYTVMYVWRRDYIKSENCERSWMNLNEEIYPVFDPEIPK